MHNGQPSAPRERIYLDNAATTWPKPDVVYEAVDRFLRHVGASAGRGAYAEAYEARRIQDEAREAICQLIGADDPTHIVFTLNCSGALNNAIQGVVRRGDHVITTAMAHNSVLRPLNALECEGVCEYTRVPCCEDGSVDIDRIAGAIKPNTRLLAVIHGSNVTGTLFPIEELGELAKRKGLLFLVDAAQTAGGYPIDVEAAQVDLLAFAGHKGPLGPLGTGVLYIRPGVEVRPLCYGGTGSVSELDTQPDIMPDRFESGSHNTAGVAGLGAGVRFLLEQGIDRVRAHKLRLLQRLWSGLHDIDGVTVYGPPPERNAGVVSFNIRGWKPHDVSTTLDEQYRIQTRPGLHCAPHAHRTIGSFGDGTVRMSLGFFNTMAHMEAAIAAVGELAAALQPAAIGR